MLGGGTLSHSQANILEDQASIEILEVSDSEWNYGGVPSGVLPTFSDLNNENFGTDNV